MSYSTLYAIDLAGSADAVERYSNGHASVVFWRLISEEYSTPFSIFGDNQIFWRLHIDTRLLPEERLALQVTYDNSVILKPEMLLVADALDVVCTKYKGRHDDCCWHFDALAEHLRSYHADNGVAGVAYHNTSVVEAVFAGEHIDGEDGENDKEIPFNLITHASKIFPVRDEL